MEKKLIGYQVYSAREDAEKDLHGTLTRIAAMGYDGVEMAGFYGHSAEDVKSILEDTGLTAISSHVPMQLIEGDMFGTIAYHQAIGCKYIAVPFLDDASRPGAAGFANVIAVIYKFGRLCRQAGIQLLYHNHDFEFCQLSGQYGLDFLYQAVPAHILKTELDVCWVKYAGEDPAAYIRKYAGRCPIIHLKDYVGVRGGKSPYGLLGEKEEVPDSEIAFEFRPVGYGCQNVEQVVAAGIESGADWFIVEQDQAVGMTPLEAAEKSIGTLKKIGLK